MKTSSEILDSCQVALTVEAEPEEMEKAMDEAYHRMVKQVSIPGFRKGKAPRVLFERHVGKDQLESEALENLIPKLYQEAIEQEEIAGIGQPDMEIIQKDPPIFKATISMPPTVELGDYHSIRITPEPIEITEENVDEAIENLRKSYATLEPAEREVQYEDVVTLDITATVEDKTILEREGESLKVSESSDVPVPGFTEQLVGMKAGEEKEFILPFPEDHPNEELAGKECQFKVKLSAVKVEILPEVDDEFAKSLGQGVETVEQLREKLRENLNASAEMESRNKLESDVIEAVIEQSKIEFPPIFTDQEIEQMINEQMMRMGGMQVEDFLKYRGITKEELNAELRPTAERRVRGSLILGKVNEAENITVSDEEIDAEIERTLQNVGEQGERMREMFSSPQARESVRDRLLTRNTLDRLIEIATSGEEVTTKEATAEEEASVAEGETREEETRTDNKEEPENEA
ncbi:MAG: trigger factor [Dehalococcoidia bacterium]